MKESYSEDLASHTGLELYAGDGNVMGVATTEVHAGQLLSSEITLFVRRPCLCSGKTTRLDAFRRAFLSGTAESQNLSMHGNSKRENREILSVSAGHESVVNSPRGTVRERHRR
jgi:hypothetical protein